MFLSLVPRRKGMHNAYDSADQVLDIREDVAATYRKLPHHAVGVDDEPTREGLALGAQQALLERA